MKNKNRDISLDDALAVVIASMPAGVNEAFEVFVRTIWEKTVVGSSDGVTIEVDDSEPEDAVETQLKAKMFSINDDDESDLSPVGAAAGSEDGEALEEDAEADEQEVVIETADEEDDGDLPVMTDKKAKKAAKKAKKAAAAKAAAEAEAKAAKAAAKGKPAKVEPVEDDGDDVVITSVKGAAKAAEKAAKEKAAKPVAEVEKVKAKPTLETAKGAKAKPAAVAPVALKPLITVEGIRASKQFKAQTKAWAAEDPQMSAKALRTYLAESHKYVAKAKSQEDLLDLAILADSIYVSILETPLPKVVSIVESLGLSTHTGRARTDATKTTALSELLVTELLAQTEA
jgi:hypothetical protein